MKDPIRRQYDLSWNRRNVAALLCLSVAAAGAIAVQASDRTWFDEAAAVSAEQALAAAEKIDPNAASFASLCRLPGVGPVRAKAIVGYRAARGPHPFRTAADLAGVHGVGPVTVERCARYLDLPAGPLGARP